MVIKSKGYSLTLDCPTETTQAKSTKISGFVLKKISPQDFSIKTLLLELVYHWPPLCLMHLPKAMRSLVKHYTKMCFVWILLTLFLATRFFKQDFSYESFLSRFLRQSFSATIFVDKIFLTRCFKWNVFQQDFFQWDFPIRLFRQDFSNETFRTRFVQWDFYHDITPTRFFAMGFFQRDFSDEIVLTRFLTVCSQFFTPQATIEIQQIYDESREPFTFCSWWN